MKIRAAIPDDKVQICNVLCRSIEELCIADHAGNRAVLDPWLANKTPENVLKWMNNPNGQLLVAVDGDTILGVGFGSASGEIMLNYVSPGARFRGVSKALLQSLENYAVQQGARQSTLTSTRTAHRFYETCGYRNNGAATMRGELSGQPMSKQLP
ncbi:GNAT family N-acetyltransferase [Phyllobacterium myrsinacearum]|uniref:GNAT superfamily N-acetyltransferase n=1 Tax=Phyllobacterium myrsinacearum TaxID=28101 RepID=A0A839EE93_9HYPH|nr:GNAT family N-acetyltransferase [Phyllobacterium myrsinacearum]MBA8878261.1 GNAT superfamily N-acetyltransferase [Phyllobacterium myrsinacearum]